jgi:hypothetical protein
MARINGVETCIPKRQVFRAAGGFDNLSRWNYIMDDFTDKDWFYHWPMVDTVKEVLADFERIVTKPGLKIIEQKQNGTKNTKSRVAKITK